MKQINWKILMVGRRNIVRRALKTIISPFYFSWQSGHFINTIKGYAVDRHGNAIPMLTYPAIDFIESISDHIKNAHVLEFGAGQSTEWFLKHCAKVVSVESNSDFFEILRLRYQNEERLTLVSSDFESISEYFDIILIDGKPRIEGAKFAVSRLKTNGILIVDNSDVQTLQIIAENLYPAGFGRVDFIGHSPTGVRKQCTSFFFKTIEFWRLASKFPAVSANSYTENLT